MSTNSSALLSASDLAALLEAGEPMVLLDGTQFQATEGRDAEVEFEAAHLPGARRFNIKHIADQTSGLPNTLPSPQQFSEQVTALGINNQTRVIVYDAKGLASAPRVWWMFRVMGHAVQVLDGGLPAWKAGGYPLESGPIPSGENASPAFESVVCPELLWSKTQVEANLIQATHQLVDARPAPRFNGEQPEPRPTQYQGHIPGSINSPWATLCEPDTKTLLPMDKLVERLKSQGIDMAQPVAATCGSGVTACTIALAFYELDGRDVPIYDGSWAEWGNLSHS